MRGQFFSADFVVAAALVAVAVGMVLQASELSTRSAAEDAGLSSPLAGDIASAFVENGPFGGVYCLQYSNGTGDCGGFSCPWHLTTAKRLVACNGAEPCLLEVSACG